MLHGSVFTRSFDISYNQCTETLAYVSMKLQNKKSVFSMIHVTVGVQIQINFNDAFKNITKHLHSFPHMHQGIRFVWPAKQIGAKYSEEQACNMYKNEWFSLWKPFSEYLENW